MNFVFLQMWLRLIVVHFFFDPLLSFVRFTQSHLLANPFAIQCFCSFLRFFPTSLALYWLYQACLYRFTNDDVFFSIFKSQPIFTDYNDYCNNDDDGMDRLISPIWHVFMYLVFIIQTGLISIWKSNYTVNYIKFNENQYKLITCQDTVINFYVKCYKICNNNIKRRYLSWCCKYWFLVLQYLLFIILENIFDEKYNIIDTETVAKTITLISLSTFFLFIFLEFIPYIVIDYYTLIYLYHWYEIDCFYHCVLNKRKLNITPHTHTNTNDTIKGCMQISKRNTIDSIYQTCHDWNTFVNLKENPPHLIRCLLFCLQYSIINPLVWLKSCLITTYTTGSDSTTCDLSQNRKSDGISKSAFEHYHKHFWDYFLIQPLCWIFITCPIGCYVIKPLFYCVSYINVAIFHTVRAFLDALVCINLEQFPNDLTIAVRFWGLVIIIPSVSLLFTLMVGISFNSLIFGIVNFLFESSSFAQKINMWSVVDNFKRLSFFSPDDQQNTLIMCAVCIMYAFYLSGIGISICMAIISNYFHDNYSSKKGRLLSFEVFMRYVMAGCTLSYAITAMDTRWLLIAIAAKSFARGLGKLTQCLLTIGISSSDRYANTLAILQGVQSNVGVHIPRKQSRLSSIIVVGLNKIFKMDWLYVKMMKYVLMQYSDIDETHILDIIVSYCLDTNEIKLKSNDSDCINGKVLCNQIIITDSTGKFINGQTGKASNVYTKFGFHTTWDLLKPTNCVAVKQIRDNMEHKENDDMEKNKTKDVRFVMQLKLCLIDAETVYLTTRKIAYLMTQTFGSNIKRDESLKVSFALKPT